MRCLAHGHLDTLLRGAGDRTSNLPVTSQAALPPELLAPQMINVGQPNQSKPMLFNQMKCIFTCAMCLIIITCFLCVYIQTDHNQPSYGNTFGLSKHASEYHYTKIGHFILNDPMSVLFNQLKVYSSHPVPDCVWSASPFTMEQQKVCAGDMH